MYLVVTWIRNGVREQKALSDKVRPHCQDILMNFYSVRKLACNDTCCSA